MGISTTHQSTNSCITYWMTAADETLLDRRKEDEYMIAVAYKFGKIRAVVYRTRLPAWESKGSQRTLSKVRNGY